MQQSGISAVIQQRHLDGGSYVQEAATVGLLGDLQNEGVGGDDVPAELEGCLLPESKRWRDKIFGFWERGEVVCDALNLTPRTRQIDLAAVRKTCRHLN